MSDLLLDERILLWVFIPIIYVTMLISLFRFYFSYYSSVSAAKKPIKNKGQLVQLKDKEIVSKCDKLILRNSLLTKEAFDSRRSFLCKNETGYLEIKGQREPVDMSNNMMNMQSTMMDGLKGNFAMMATTIPAMMWINSFFSGFLPAKVPFSLTQKFRSMTQSGLDLQNLDVRYVSGVSFYFIILFGLGQINSLFLGDEMTSEQEQMQMKQGKKAGGMGAMGGNPMMGGGMMGGAGMMGQPNQQPQKAIFKPQIQALELVDHKFALEQSPKFALSKLKSFLQN